MSTVTCPLCGSAEIDRSTRTETFSTPYGPAMEAQLAVYTCRACGESGDFTGENDCAILKAEESSNRASIATITEELAKTGVRIAYVERALRLPPRTVARWKAQSCSAAGLALLRMVRTYPWLLGVADANFDASVARQAVVEGAARVVGEFLCLNQVPSAAVAILYDGATHTVNGAFKVHMGECAKPINGVRGTPVFQPDTGT